MQKNQAIFFTGTFFVIKKTARSRGFNCIQRFVLDMGYVYVSTMNSVIFFSKYLNIFAKEVGVPEAITADSHKCHKPKEVKLVCHNTGTALRILDGSTQWATKAQLYIGVSREAVRKDMLKEDSPPLFWDYCAERREQESTT